MSHLNIFSSNFTHFLCVQKFRTKINSLSYEARLIRKYEGQVDKATEIYSKKISNSQKLESVIKQDLEDCVYHASFVKSKLREHRTDIIRQEQRATLLAYAFYRNRSYKSVERCAKTEPNVKRIVEILKSVAECYVSANKVNSWLDA